MVRIFPSTIAFNGFLATRPSLLSVLFPDWPLTLTLIPQIFVFTYIKRLNNKKHIITICSVITAQNGNDKKRRGMKDNAKARKELKPNGLTGQLGLSWEMIAFDMKIIPSCENGLHQTEREEFREPPRNLHHFWSNAWNANTKKYKYMQKKKQKKRENTMYLQIHTTTKRLIHFW